MKQLVATVGTEAVSAVHAAGAGSLETRAAGECTAQLHHRAGDLVAHGDLAARDTVAGGDTAVVTVGTVVARGAVVRLGDGGVTGQRVGAGLGGSGPLATEKAGLGGGGAGGLGHCECCCR